MTPHRLRAMGGTVIDAVEVTGTRQRDAWLHNVLPDVEQVRPGLWSIPLPLSTGTMRFVNVYAFESSDGLTLVDAGWDDDASWDHLGRGLARLGFAITDVRRLLVTHAHRDHYGQAGRVRRESGCVIAMHEQEAATLPQHYGSTQKLIDRMLDWLTWCGVPADEAPAMLPRSLTIPVDELPEPDTTLADGDVVRFGPWEVTAVWTPGHTPGHLTYAESGSGLLLTGDHVLPRITPNISVNPRQDVDALERYLASLRRLRGLAADEVLPAHEYRFRGLDLRIDQLLHHHEERLAHVLSQVPTDRWASTYEIGGACEWARPWDDTPPLLRRLAVGETLSHLVLLERRDLIAGREVSAAGGSARVHVWRVGSDAP